MEEKDDTTVSATKAGNEEAFLPMEDRLVAPDNPDELASILSFFPTADVSLPKNWTIYNPKLSIKNI